MDKLILLHSVLCILEWYLTALTSNDLKSNHLGLNVGGFE